jgi:hypothetical protein
MLYLLVCACTVVGARYSDNIADPGMRTPAYMLVLPGIIMRQQECIISMPYVQYYYARSQVKANGMHVWQVLGSLGTRIVLAFWGRVANALI